MIGASELFEVAKRWGYDLYTGVPCSYLSPLINKVIDEPNYPYFAVNNEGESVAFAAGASLAGRKPVVLLQNSGLGNAVNPIVSLLEPFKIPLLFICTWRGGPDRPDEPQHRLMGEITPDMLSLMNIQYTILSGDSPDLNTAFERVCRHMEEHGRSYAFILPHGTLEPRPLQTRSRLSCLPMPNRAFRQEGEPIMNRTRALRRLLDHVDGAHPIIGTTGKTGREMFTLNDAENHLYMVGSMGCAASLGLGLALHITEQSRVFVVDGDGALLMRMEALVSIGGYRPKNLVHLVLDNNSYDSTGGQQTLSDGVRFEDVALACGYASAQSLNREDSFISALSQAMTRPGPHLIHLRILPGSPPDLQRPSLSPDAVKQRFIAYLQRMHNNQEIIR